MEPAALIDIRTPGDVCRNLGRLGLNILKVPCTENVEVPISGHPDIQLFVHDSKIFVHPGIDKEFLRQIEGSYDVTICSTVLQKRYPLDIAYNIACTGNYAIHRFDCTEPLIHSYLKQKNMQLINTKQGYSRCSVVIVDEQSIITYDRSIHSSAINAGMNSLLISPGYVDLPGYRHGLIGGATGRFMDMVLFSGHINDHPDRNSIYEYIESRSLKLITLSCSKVLDIGSIIVI